MVIVMYGYNLQRLLGDKRKILIILFLLLLPSIEVIQYIYEKNAFGVELPSGFTLFLFFDNARVSCQTKASYLQEHPLEHYSLDTS